MIELVWTYHSTNYLIDWFAMRSQLESTYLNVFNRNCFELFTHSPSVNWVYFSTENALWFSNYHFLIPPLFWWPEHNDRCHLHSIECEWIIDFTFMKNCSRIRYASGSYGIEAVLNYCIFCENWYSGEGASTSCCMVRACEPWSGIFFPCCSLSWKT